MFNFWSSGCKIQDHITNQQNTIQTKFSGPKIENIPKQNMQKCEVNFAAPDLRHLIFPSVTGTM
jgi:hypothetical protein